MPGNPENKPQFFPLFAGGVAAISLIALGYIYSHYEQIKSWLSPTTPTLPTPAEPEFLGDVQVVNSSKVSRSPLDIRQEDIDRCQAQFDFIGREPVTSYLVDANVIQGLLCEMVPPLDTLDGKDNIHLITQGGEVQTKYPFDHAPGCIEFVAQGSMNSVEYFGPVYFLDKNDQIIVQADPLETPQELNLSRASSAVAFSYSSDGVNTNNQYDFDVVHMTTEDIACR